MNASKKKFYENQAQTVIKKMQQRGMDAYYCDDVASARAKLVELMGSKSKSIGYGGSATIDDNGFKDELLKAGHSLIEREKYTTPEELKDCKAQLINADAFIMSSNAITLDGELVNIDGRGNRVSFLIYGPEEVYVIAGMNKITINVDEGIKRVRNFASPPNTVRLNRDTPCAKTGVCGNCLNGSICSQIVVTRTSMIPHRIKVILVGEELGF